MTDTATLLAHTIPNALQQTISIISGNLLYPARVVLIILIAGSLIELGGFLFEWRNRHRDNRSLQKKINHRWRGGSQSVVISLSSLSRSLRSFESSRKIIKK